MVSKEYLNIKINGKERNCGYIDWNERVYVSKRTEDHQFRKFGNGFGISIIILNYLQEKGIDVINIAFNSLTLCSKIADFYEKGVKYQDNGDLQLILPLRYFHVKTNSIVEKQSKLI